jgi:hypothetical protein
MFTYTSKNILLIIGIILSVFLKPENIRLSCIFCPHISRAFPYFWQQITHPDGTRFKYSRCGYSNKLNFTSCAAGNAGKKGTFDSVLKFEILKSGREFSVANRGVTLAP